MGINKTVILGVLLMCPFLLVGQSKTEPEGLYFSGRFLEAGVLEGDYSFGFQDTAGTWMYFLYEPYQGDSLPLTLYLDEAEHFANPDYYGLTFRVGYTSFFEERGESGEPYWFYKIRSLEILSEGTDLDNGSGEDGLERLEF